LERKVREERKEGKEKHGGRRVEEVEKRKMAKIDGMGGEKKGNRKKRGTVEEKMNGERKKIALEREEKGKEK
jgi:hypothetical protein